MPYATISPTDDFFKNIDLSRKKEEILKQIAEKINFKPDNTQIWESRYWHKGVGAFNISGIFTDKNGRKYKAVLKVQGVKPKISESEIIEKFNHQNKSPLIKLPRVLFYLPWNNKLNFEVYVFEKVEAEFIIKPHEPASKENLKEFFRAYREYKDKALQKPFLPKPKNLPPYIEKFKKWRTIRLDNPLKYYITKEEDKKLLKIAEFISKTLKNQPPEFQHGHLSVYDIKKKGKNYYLFSNLFWSWYYPLYDSVFAFEWFILGLAHLPSKTIEEQINLWLEAIKNALQNSQCVKRTYGKGFLKHHHLGVVERLAAALNLDMLLIGKKEDILNIKPILWKYLEKYLEKF